MPAGLLAAYVQWCGCSAEEAGGSPKFVPAHLFPQWSFPAMAQALACLYGAPGCQLKSRSLRACLGRLLCFVLGTGRRQG